MKMEYTEELAEIVGIMLGDGCLYLDRLGKYQTSICLHKEEISYLNDVKKLMENHFNYKFCITKIKNAYLLRNTSVFLGNQLIKAGLKSGKKVKNKVIIPQWIFTNKNFLKSVIRGLFDTDGCVYKKYDDYLQIQFKFGCLETTESLRNAIVLLEYNPTKIQKGWNNAKKTWFWKFYFSRQKEIDRFFREIKPRNSKHLLRYKKIRSGDAEIRTQI
jgi:hypothetical protein